MTEAHPPTPAISRNTQLLIGLPANCAARGLRNGLFATGSPHEPSVQHGPSPIAAFTGSSSFDAVAAEADALAVAAVAATAGVVAVVPAAGPDPSAADAAETIANAARPKNSFFIREKD